MWFYGLSPSFVNIYYLGWTFFVLESSLSLPLLFVHSVLPFQIFLSWLVWGICWSADSSGLPSSSRKVPNSLQILKLQLSLLPTKFRERKPRFPEDLLNARHSHTFIIFLAPPSHSAKCSLFCWWNRQTGGKGGIQKAVWIQTLCCPASD